MKSCRHQGEAAGGTMWVLWPYTAGCYAAISLARMVSAVSTPRLCSCCLALLMAAADLSACLLAPSVVAAGNALWATCMRLQCPHASTCPCRWDQNRGLRAYRACLKCTCKLWPGLSPHRSTSGPGAHNRCCAQRLEASRLSRSAGGQPHIAALAQTGL